MAGENIARRCRAAPAGAAPRFADQPWSSGVSPDVSPGFSSGSAIATL